VQVSNVSYQRLALPERLDGLRDLAYNLWWSWNPDATNLWADIDPDAWDDISHNPIQLLHGVQRQRLDELAGDDSFVARLSGVQSAFKAYMEPHEPPWYPRTYPGDNMLVAYFCAEFGVHESLPIYSGGLGVLAGDHCKTASDLGLPFVAVGLWYTQGYFKQKVDYTGKQIAVPDRLPQSEAPLLFAGTGGSDLIIEVPVANRQVRVRIWRVEVGRISIFLLDPDVEGNSWEDRGICTGLYGGDREARIRQEILLGVGGVRALGALDISPTRWHMNEGHAAFMGFERIRAMVQAGLEFTTAWPAQADSSIFTTHTPVPAGNEVFRADLVTKYLPDMAAGMGLDPAGMVQLAREDGAPYGLVAMTPLALRFSHRANGVSRLHGAVARSMWAKQFPGVDVDRVPITSVTNGVHTATWVAPTLAALFSRYLGPKWLEHVDDPAIWEAIDTIPDDELWAVHAGLKQKLIETANASAFIVGKLNPSALTIGFARRFATYKRAMLFFRDADRARRILGDREHPVQIVFAGKAHPADTGGQGLIQSIVAEARSANFAGHLVFLPGYDLALARTLVQGVDMWLNNPERPQEASGTSGEKAALNGVPNCSIRDGWWDEGFNGGNGWAFGAAVGNDAVDSAELYDVLQDEVIPAYFDRDTGGISSRWVAVMKESIRSLAPAFSAQRMVKEYTERLYR